MREEKESILKCLEICKDVSSHIDTIQSRNDENDFNAAPAVAAWPDAARSLVGCRQNREVQLQALRRKLMEQATHLSMETEQARRRELIEEVESLRKGLEICNNAYKEADQNRTNVFEDVSAGEDCSQIIASTVGEPILARNIKTGARSIQILGQMSDVTIQQATNRSTKYDHPRPLEHRSGSFEGRYGTGRDLQSPKGRG